jgi:integrase
MASRKDSKGRMLKKGEFVRKSDGRYVYSYTDPLGRRKFIYDNDLPGLRKKEDLLVRDQLDGLDTIARSQATLNSTFDRYISLKCNLRGTTKSGYIYTYDHFVREDFGLKKIADIKYSDVLQFYLYLIKDRKLAMGTLDSIHCVLHPTFQLAVRDDILRKNPSDGVVAEVTKLTDKHRGTRHALSEDQQKAFMGYVADHPVFNPWWPLFTVLPGTGGRIGEILGLRWEDVDFEKKTISINHSLVYYKDEETGKCTMRIHLPKTESGIRIIPMLDVVKEALEMAKDEQELEGAEQPTVDGLTGFIFLNQFGDVLNQSSVNRAIKRILEYYNYEEDLAATKEGREPVLLPKFSCHVLRHTFATRLCRVCTNLKVIQYIMGHKSIETTMDVYAEATGDKNKEVFEVLSEALADLF